MRAKYTIYRFYSFLDHRPGTIVKDFYGRRYRVMPAGNIVRIREEAGRG
jgi:hypothetical protein